MPTPNARRIRHANLTFAENDSREVPLQDGFLERGLYLEVEYTHNPTADGTMVREFPCPIRRLTLVTDNGRTLHDARPADLMREAIVYDQTPIEALVSGPATITAAGGAKTGFAIIPLAFMEPFAGKDGELTALPTWIYDNLTLRIEYGDRSDVVIGGAGTLSGVTVKLTQVGRQADWSQLGDPYVWGTQLGVSGHSFTEYALDAAAEEEYTKPLPTTADIRAVIFQALDADGEGSDAIIEELSLVLENNRNQWTKTPWRTLRADNAKVFGKQLPKGMAIFEMADDQDITDILEARKLKNLDVVAKRNAVAGTLRVIVKRLEPGRGLLAPTG